MAIWTRAALVLQCLCRSSKKAVASEGNASNSRHEDAKQRNSPAPRLMIRRQQQRTHCAHPWYRSACRSSKPPSRGRTRAVACDCVTAKPVARKATSKATQAIVLSNH
jgi:hypothetical protein